MTNEIPQVKKILTATRAAQELGLTRQTVNKRIASGGFKSAMKLDSRQYVVRRDEVEAMKNGTHEDYVVPQDDLCEA